MVMDTQPLEMGQKRARRLIYAPRFPKIILLLEYNIL